MAWICVIAFVFGFVSAVLISRLARKFHLTDATGIAMDLLYAWYYSRPADERDQQKRHALGAVVGASVCGALAGILSVTARGRSLDLLVPIVFVIVVLACARWFGSVSGVLSVVTAAIIFAWWLYAPYDSIAVSDGMAMVTLTLFVIAGASLSVVVGRKRQIPATASPAAQAAGTQPSAH